ncbi:MAG: IS1595 family transposase [Rhodobacteraceae bacterium]|nr:IS1595 family transposase [Paracoccaceae bacterium]MCY4197746.1 IS1595 family transposase [Paracoccaceae bacterium]
MAHATPGKSYRIGMSDMECMDMFPDDKTAEAWFESHRWSNGRICPHCGSERTRVEKNRKPMPYRCKDCRKHFSVRTDTVMARSKISLRKWAIGIYMSVTNIKGVSSTRLHRALKISQSSAWFMAMRIREGFWQPKGTFEETVEVDETYMGGKQKNMPNSKRKQMTGRGTVDKTIVVGVKDRKTNQVAAWMNTTISPSIIPLGIMSSSWPIPTSSSRSGSC